MSIKNFLVRKYATWKMKDVPEGQREMMLTLLEKNPALMRQIGEEIERRKKGGESEMKAAMQVLKKHRDELAGLMQQ